MPTYAIGDVQGCYQALQAILQKIRFNAQKDQLWFVGDLVNRGPQSLEVLRFIKNLGPKAKIVLGNHDLHLLAVHYGVRDFFKEDTIQDILEAPDRNELIHWLRQHSLVHYDKKLNFVMVHAGFAPMWDLQKALTLNQEMASLLQGEEAQLKTYLHHAYGNEPDRWEDSLEGWPRLRVITNYFTRMRFCDAKGRLDLKIKGGVPECPSGFYPWFLVPQRKTEAQNIVFGHWAALQGETRHPHVFALDTGIVWGRSLTAMCLETAEKYSIDAESV